MSKKRADYIKKFQNYLWDIIKDHYKRDSSKANKKQGRSGENENI